MPLTTIRVMRVDSVRRTGPAGAFRAYCITGTTGAEWDLGSFQAQTTSDLQASLCERSQYMCQNVVVLWRDGRYGKEMLTVHLEGMD